MTKRELKYFSVGFFLSLVFVLGMNDFRNILENFFYKEISEPFENMVLAQLPIKDEKPAIEAKSVISLKINKYGREKILLRQNIDEILPIASLTKLMTAVVVLENQNNYSFSKTIVLSEKAASQDNVPIYGNFKQGDSFTIENILRLMLIYSSNDVAWALSEVITTENFVQKMNQKAQELGLTNTNFINPTGLEPKELNGSQIDPMQLNHSTSQDLLNLTRYILDKHPLIFQMSLDQGPYATHNGVSGIYFPPDFRAVGGKTGYTNEAGGCMLLVSENSQQTIFINILLGASSPTQRIVETQKLINWQTQ
ncbi:MAG: serine hydrolase [Patescibacteria group bacterium]|nr:serine hydrolase [Patescibacteria group bacterium]MBU1877186.1 serine hydrolase [Patescibacteria group bacterium]